MGAHRTAYRRRARPGLAPAFEPRVVADTHPGQRRDLHGSARGRLGQTSDIGVGQEAELVRDKEDEPVWERLILTAALLGFFMISLDATASLRT